jgi:hypothetical protein
MPMLQQVDYRVRLVDLLAEVRTWLDVEVPPGTARKETEVAVGMLLQGRRT